MQKHMRIITIITTIVLALAIGFFFLRSGGTSSNSLLSVDTVEENAGGANVVSLLAQLQSVQLNESLFSNVAFQSLVDYGVELEDLPVGRSNPFAPIGTDAPLEVEEPEVIQPPVEDEPVDVGTTTPESGEEG